jgi:poly-gamma-glutamate synthesis protein (capsule biosynthesis protein)
LGCQAIRLPGGSLRQKPAAPASEKPPEPPRPKGKVRVSLAVVGDIVMHMPQVEAALLPGGGYDFKDVFKEVKPIIEQADIALCNFETTISTPQRGYSGYPCFKSPEAILEALKFAGFDVATTANNHAFDAGEFGVVNTCDKLDQYGLLHTGRARSAEERDKVLMVSANQIKIAVVAYTYGTNGMEGAIRKDRLPYMVNLWTDMEVVKKDIQKARKAGSDVVVACVHWGNEYVRKPDEVQKHAAAQFLEAGADIVFGSHPHVLQPMERRTVTREGKDRDAFVIYSLGNFISNQRHETTRYTDSGIILNLEVIKDLDSGEVSLGQITYVPTWVDRYTSGGKFRYRVLPVGRFIDQATGYQKQRLQDVWKETTSLMGDKFQAIK